MAAPFGSHVISPPSWSEFPYFCLDLYLEPSKLDYPGGGLHGVCGIAMLMVVVVMVMVVVEVMVGGDDGDGLGVGMVVFRVV